MFVLAMVHTGILKSLITFFHHCFFFLRNYMLFQIIYVIVLWDSEAMIGTDHECYIFAFIYGSFCRLKYRYTKRSSIQAKLGCQNKIFINIFIGNELERVFVHIFLILKLILFQDTCTCYKNHLEYPKSTFDNQNWDISTFYLEIFYKHCFRKKEEIYGIHSSLFKL